MNALDDALCYAAQGVHVHPFYNVREDGSCACGKADCASPGKHPCSKHGKDDATTDEATIRSWWSRKPDAQVGMNCGASGVVTLDTDVHGETDGREAWAALVAEHGPALETAPMAETPGGGFHALFRMNSDRIGCPTNAPLGVGIDVKGVGGSIILPSAASAGRDWVPGRELAAVLMPPLPRAVAELLTYTTTPAGRRRAAGQVEKAAAVAEGGRNAYLASRAGSMRRDGFSPAALLAALQVENAEACEPPLSAGEVEKIAASVGKYPPAEPTPTGGPFHLTELGNAERLAARHKGSVYAVRGADELRGYDPARGIYTAEHGLLVRYAIDVVRSMYTEAADGLTDTDKDLRRHAERSEAKRALDAMLDLCKSLESLEAEIEDFDADPELLNTQSGVVNLATGDLHPHAAASRMTKIAAAAYTPGAATPMWDAFLARIFEGDAELIAFMQRLFGYALTGYIGEQIFAIFYGVGANGKSVLVDCWQAAMGDYAGVAALKTFLPHGNDAVRTDFATLNGRRLVSTSESKPGQMIDAATIKVLTSRHVTCRFNYARGEFTYTPQYLVVLDTNFKPQVHCDDYAIKRRVLLVPFRVLIPDEEQDTKFTEKLIAAELPGILAWGVAGAVDYLKNGLCIPDRVRTATDAYRCEMDALHEFWGKWLVFGEAEKWTTAEALRDALKTWAKENGVEERDLPKGAEWGRELRQRGARSDKKWVGNKTTSVWYGVQIVGADEQEEMI